MIQFNQLSISQDKKYLVIDVQIEDLDYYQDNTLDSIFINNQVSFSPTGPVTEQPEPKKAGSIVIYIDCGGKKHYREYISLEDNGIPINQVEKQLFFVWVVANGQVQEGTPCGITRSNLALGVVYDKYPIYKQGMSLINQVDRCEIPTALNDFILQNKAFELSLESCNYPKAIEYWNNFFIEKEQSVKHNCGCHGYFR